MVHRQRLLDFSSVFSLLVHLFSFDRFKLLEFQVSLDFSLSLGLCLSSLKVSVELIELLVSLALQIFFNQQLGALELIKNVLEVLGSTCVSQSVLVISKFVNLHLIKLLRQIYLQLIVLIFETGDFTIVFVLDFDHNVFFHVCDLIVVLLQLLVNFDQLFIKLSAADAALF